MDHLRDYVQNLGKYEVVQNDPMYEVINQENCIFLGNFIP
jgi:hypothetical protein